MPKRRTGPEKTIAKAYLSILDQNDGDEEAAARQVGLTTGQFAKIIKQARDLVRPVKSKRSRR